MLDELRALVALESTGTVSAAAIHLRLTQSAVSKRLRALEDQLRFKVVEADGRKLKITDLGNALLVKAKPLLLEFEALKDIQETPRSRTLRIGLSDSIASSWGPKLLKKAMVEVQTIQLEIHVHRSTSLLELLRAGRYDLGLVTGRPQERNLVWEPLGNELMVLVGKPTPPPHLLLTIEKASATWKDIGEAVRKHPVLRHHVILHVESFSAALQMAREGFGQALVPAGLASAAGMNGHSVVAFSPKLKRQISLVGRKSLIQSRGVRELRRAMNLRIHDIIAAE